MTLKLNVITRQKTGQVTMNTTIGKVELWAYCSEHDYEGWIKRYLYAQLDLSKFLVEGRA